MDKISILDCTLRDGGYINDFAFGRQCMTAIIKNLQASGVEIVECGFLQSGKTDPDQSLYSCVEAIKLYLPSERNERTMFVAMIAYGDISIDEISRCDGTSVTGIRLTFHEQDVDAALVFARQLKEKGL